MSEIAMLRLLINERLTAAAEEIFSVFGRALCDLEERLSLKSAELERHRRLLELSAKPCVKVEEQPQHADLPQLQESASSVASLEASEPPEELPHVKEEPEEMWSAEEQAGGASTHGDHVLKMTLIQTGCGVTDKHPDGPNLPPPLTAHQHGTLNGLDCEPGTSSSSASTRTDAPQSLRLAPPPHVAKCRALRSGLLPSSANNNSSAPYVCSVCGKAFGQRMYWAAHVRLHRGGGGGHGGHGTAARRDRGGGGDNKSFRCDICGKWLTRLDGLEKHLRVHTGEKPYGCHLCGKRFSDNSNYKRHIRRHGGGGGSRGDAATADISADVLGVLQDTQ